MSSKFILNAMVLLIGTAAMAGNGEVGSVGGGELKETRTITLKVPKAFTSKTKFVANHDGSVSVIDPEITVGGVPYRVAALINENIQGVCSLIGMLPGQDQYGVTMRYISYTHGDPTIHNIALDLKGNLSINKNDSPNSRILYSVTCR